MKKILLLNFFLCFAFTANAQWDTLITGTTATFNHGAFVSQDSGIVVGFDVTTNNGVARFTSNGGSTWVDAIFNSSLPAVNAVAFFGQQDGWMVCDSGKIFFSHDGGFSWTLSQIITQEDLTAVSFPTSSSLWIGGKSGSLYNTLDGGITWDTINSETMLQINDLYFVYANTGWVIGNGGYMGVTADGGVSWNYFPQPYFGFFQPRGFCYAGTTNTAYCVGEDGLAITSTDAGMTWSPFYTSSTDHLNSVRFGSDYSGVICGDNNFIFRTNNGGAWWWQDTVPGMSSNLNHVIWASPSVCYIVGSNGRVLKNNTDITSVKEQPADPLSVSAYPNPFDAGLNILVRSEQNCEGQIQISDATGRVLYSISQKIIEGNNTIHPEELDALDAGAYFLQVRTPGAAGTISVIKR